MSFLTERSPEECQSPVKKQYDYTISRGKCNRFRENRPGCRAEETSPARSSSESRPQSPDRFPDVSAALLKSDPPAVCDIARQNAPDRCPPAGRRPIMTASNICSSTESGRPFFTGALFQIALQGTGVVVTALWPLCRWRRNRCHGSPHNASRRDCAGDTA